MIDEFGAHLSRLYEKIAELEGRMERTHRPGPVTDVDYSDKTKPRARIQIGTDADGKPVKGPWQPICSHAGARAIHAPITIGQTMLALSPDGNFENGVLMHYGFSSKTPSPSTSPEDHVDQIGDVITTLNKSGHTRSVKKMTVAHTGDGVTIDMDGTKFAFSKSGLKVTGGSLSHNDLNIGSTHVHGKVQPGGADTGPPEA